jgi:hypothetical protein
VKHDGEAVADNVVREVQAGVDKRSHLPSLAPRLAGRKCGRGSQPAGAPSGPRAGTSRYRRHVGADSRGGGRPATAR